MKTNDNENITEDAQSLEEQAENAEETTAAAEQPADEAKPAEVDYLDKYQRTLAEFDNFRKRTVREKAAMYDNGVSGIATALLPVIDNFERAFAAVPDEERDSAFFAGMNQIYKQFGEVLKSKGIAPIEAVGKPFNPEFHAAIAHVDDENYGENEVIEEMQRGYLLNGKVLRHSVVKTAN